MQWILTSRWRLLPATIGAVALVAMVSLAYSQPPGPPPGGPGGPYERGPRGPREERGDRPVETTELSGNVQGFNRNPLGAIDSLMLTADGKTVQVNFPPDLGGPIAGLASAGDSVKITAEKTPHRADHEIYADMKEGRFYFSKTFWGLRHRIVRPDAFDLICGLLEAVVSHCRCCLLNF